ncbi:maleylpyruvate isomerase N-terminal domain-containing protein [Gordonia jinghuaiqii]|uniref:Maleylpyruvate isomerase N-terminal domain-containing protein n=1 Tax=Gordonia jinghuaiqii TaxID=2758710 RepID=A0A7D7LVW2_9ACTN|nr:maleylpyruvate isomerase N-terminal domain-containing protein [Gordonia jinghuaiqii]QMT02881.1 maleylpyruvate isomerase N-terminal domain-containing protein [Gordonia jinghuaiqii]
MFSRFDYIDAAVAAGERFVELVAAVDDPDTRLSETPGWTLTDCLGHVALAPSRFLGLAHGEGEWCCNAVDVPDFNAKQIANLPTRDVGALSRQLIDDLNTLVDEVSHFHAQVPKMHYDGDLLIRADAALGLLIGEFVVHGHDIARAIGARWWVEPEVVLMIIRARQQILPGWVDTANAVGHNGTYDIRLRGCGERHLYEFTDGELVIDPPRPRRPDVHISVDPTTALLAGYGRLSTAWVGITGKAIAWGAKPWLAPRLAQKFLPA